MQFDLLHLGQSCSARKHDTHEQHAQGFLHLPFMYVVVCSFPICPSVSIDLILIPYTTTPLDGTAGWVGWAFRAIWWMGGTWVWVFLFSFYVNVDWVCFISCHVTCLRQAEEKSMVVGKFQVCGPNHVPLVPCYPPFR